MGSLGDTLLAEPAVGAEPQWHESDWIWDPKSLTAAPKKAPSTKSADSTKSTTEEEKLVVCQVHGCEVDLAAESARSRRLRTCNKHQKALEVDMKGVMSRFCQQCMRIHPLTQFDAEKRGCRKSLERHNLRRKRKGVIKRLDKQIKEWQSNTSWVPTAAPAARAPPGVMPFQPQFFHPMSGAMMQGPQPAQMLLAMQQHQQQQLALQQNGMQAMYMAGQQGHVPGSNGLVMANTPSGQQMIFQQQPSPLLFAQQQLLAASQAQQQQQLMMLPNQQMVAVPMQSQAQAIPQLNATLHQQQQQQLLQQIAAAQANISKQQAAPVKMEKRMSTAGSVTDYGSLSPTVSLQESAQPTRSTDSSQFPSENNSQFDPQLEVQQSAMSGTSSVAPTFDQICAVPLDDMDDASIDDLLFGEELDSVLNVSMKFLGATPGDMHPELRGDLVNMLSVDPTDVDGAIRPGCVHMSVDFTLRNNQHYSAALEGLVEGIKNTTSPGSGMPWGQFDTDVHLPNATVKVRGGQIVGWSTQRIGPVINRLAPVASSGFEVELSASGISDADVSVLCRVGGKYYDLQIAEIWRKENGEAVITAMLPTNTTGLAFIEVMQEGNDQMLLSEPVPMLLTHFSDAAEEISLISQWQNPPSRQRLTAILKVLAQVLHPSTWDPPTTTTCAKALNLAARCGWSATFEELLDNAREIDDVVEVVDLANRSAPGLLCSAVMSGSVEAVVLVLATLEEVNLPYDAAQKIMSNGMTALHVAAQNVAVNIIQVLMATSPSAQEAWHTAQAGPLRLTPAQIFGQNSMSGALGTAAAGTEDEPSIDNSAEEASTFTDINAEDLNVDDEVESRAGGADDLWGLRPVKALRTQSVRVVLPVVLFLAMIPLGFSTSVLLWTTALWSVGILGAIPFVHATFYEKPLRELRALAVQRGIAIGPSFRFVDAGVQRAFDGYALSKCSGLFGHLVFCACLIIPGLRPIWSAYERQGIFHWVSLLPLALSVATLLPLRCWYTSCLKRDNRKWIHVVADTLVFVMMCGFSLYFWANGEKDYTLPSWMLNRDRFMLLVQALALKCIITHMKAVIFGAPIHRIFVSKAIHCSIFMAITGAQTSNAVAFGVVHRHLWVHMLFVCHVISLQYCATRITMEVNLIRNFLRLKPAAAQQWYGVHAKAE